ncbi:MAG: hypothetical protein AABW83_00570 [Nanoarchaeota archaeon]
MGKYTEYDYEIDEYLQKNYFDKIIKSFVKDCNPISILLFGGFGKGEGSLQFLNGKPIPFNDFDFYVVTKEKLSDEELNKISMNASKEIGMGGLEIAYFPDKGYDTNKYFHVDVRCLPLNKMNKLMNIQRYYELKYGSQIIYGEDIISKIKEIKKEDLPESDGLRNLFNKLHTMLLGLREYYNEDQRKIRIFWSYKCYMSICESLLILNKEFAPTAKERSEIFCRIYKNNFPYLYKEIPDLTDKVKKATDFKIKPNFNEDPEKLWKSALKDIIKVFEFYIREISGINDVGKAINKKLPYYYFKPFLKDKIGFNFFPSQYILNLGYVKILAKEKEFFIKPLFTWKDVGLRMILPIYYLLKYKIEENEEYLEKAYNELNKFIRVEKKEFWYLRERALRAYGLYYEQRLL